MSDVSYPVGCSCWAGYVMPNGTRADPACDLHPAPGHVLTALDGSKGLCGGLRACKNCQEGS